MVIQIYIFNKGMLYNRKIINCSNCCLFSYVIFFIVILLSDVKLTIRTFLEIFNFDNFLNNLFPIISIAGTILHIFLLL